jgi:hypothetical protein
MRWTEEEIKLLVANQDASASELATLLPSRSEKAIAAKMLRLFPSRRKLILWSREDRWKLIELVRKETPLSEIYAAFPTRTPSAIRSQITYLKKRQW